MPFHGAPIDLYLPTAPVGVLHGSSTWRYGYGLDPIVRTHIHVGALLHVHEPGI